MKYGDDIKVIEWDWQVGFKDPIGLFMILSEFSPSGQLKMK